MILTGYTCIHFNVLDAFIWRTRQRGTIDLTHGHTLFIPRASMPNAYCTLCTHTQGYCMLYH